MPSSFESDVIKAHNEYRANHNAAPLKQKDELTNVAQKWAKHLASSGKFGHSNHKDYGENIAMTSAKNPTAMWYDEIHKYDFKRPGFKSGIGHFTQVVWKNSTEIGIGVATDGKGTLFAVANYAPAGNFRGQFEENVPKPK
uniref:SCP domain-containing protein n=1 Tax=Ciona savignyi TaxID=51511 RepID=H2YZD9_CIOSA